LHIPDRKQDSDLRPHGRNARAEAAERCGCAEIAVLATGAGTIGLENVNLSTGMDAVRMTGGSLISQSSDAIISQGPLNVTTSGTVVTGGGGALLEAFDNNPVFQPTVVNLTATQRSVLTGDAFVEPNSTANISLLTSSTWTGAAFNVTNVNLDLTSTWNVTANSTVSQTVTNAGLIQFLPPIGTPTALASYKTLTTGNYIGAGGTLGLNTFLDTDGSPSDRLVINGGSTSGNSRLHIANTGGGGAVTTGNGILVVDTINGGTTVPGNFALAGTVVAGPYEYRLFRSSVDGSNTDAWYLRSSINCALTPSDPACDGPTPLPPGPVPDFRPETSFYAAIPSLTLLYGRNLLDTLHERVGDEEDIRGRRDLHQFSPDTGMWGRVIGITGQQNNDPAAIFGSGPHYKYDIFGMQAGQDLWRSEHADGSRDHAGIYFAVGGARGNVTHFDGVTGNDDFQAYSLGGYWTHFGPSGWYVDAVLQGTYYDVLGGIRQSPGALRISTNGRAIAASIEIGYKVSLPWGFFIEPQTQLVYQTVDLSNAHDPVAQIRFANVDSLAARVGARFGRTWALDDERAGGFVRTVTAWLRPNLWHEFRGDPLTEFSSDTGFVPFRSDIGGPWGELNVGVNGQVNRFTSLFANASYQSRFEGKTYAYDGKLGIRVNW
jgi:outer membrane autotransporter protein